MVLVDSTSSNNGTCGIIVIVLVDSITMILRDIITMVLVYRITIVLGDSITGNNGTVRYSTF